MGNCPSGFQLGKGFTCRINCPDDFYSTDGACVYKKDARRLVSVSTLPVVGPRDKEIPTSFEDEKTRFESALRGVRDQIREDEAIAKTLGDQSSDMKRDYNKIQTEYAAFQESQKIQRAVRETEQSLRPFRAKTAPADDLEKERRAITIEARQTLIFAQIALFLLVLSLVCYILLPRDWAHGITFLLLCVGVASGFFLRK